MTDLPAPSTVIVNPPPPVVKSGWRTSEAWIAMFLLGMLTWALQQLLSILPTLAADPAMPGWIIPIFSLAPVGIGWLMKLVWAKYAELRHQLKLAALGDPTIAQAQNVGGGAASADVAAVLNAANS
jgi:hypothetical protein